MNILQSYNPAVNHEEGPARSAQCGVIVQPEYLFTL